MAMELLDTLRLSHGVDKDEDTAPAFKERWFEMSLRSNSSHAYVSDLVPLSKLERSRLRSQDPGID